jgi:phosphate acetyltransferase
MNKPYIATSEHNSGKYYSSVSMLVEEQLKWAIPVIIEDFEDGKLDNHIETNLSFGLDCI